MDAYQRYPEYLVLEATTPQLPPVPQLFLAPAKVDPPPPRPIKVPVQTKPAPPEPMTDAEIADRKEMLRQQTETILRLREEKSK